MKLVSIIALIFFLFSCKEIEVQNEELAVIPKIERLAEKIDTESLKHWSYEIDYEFEAHTDTVDALGQIRFKRTESIIDTLHEKVYKKPWFPSIDFEIYDISDINHAKRMSSRVKLLSSCLGANVGGDLIIIDNYIFVNTSVCINCIENESEIDFCRPIIDKIFSRLVLKENENLENIGDAIGLIMDEFK